MFCLPCSDLPDVMHVIACAEATAEKAEPLLLLPLLARKQGWQLRSSQQHTVRPHYKLTPYEPNVRALASASDHDLLP
jgi:hypothetical protein